MNIHTFNSNTLVGICCKSVSCVKQVPIRIVLMLKYLGGKKVWVFFFFLFLSLSMTDRNGLTEVLLGQKIYNFHECCCSAYNGLWVNLSWMGLGMPGESFLLDSGKTYMTYCPPFTPGCAFMGPDCMPAILSS